MLELLIPTPVLSYLHKLIAALVAILFTHITIMNTSNNATPYMRYIKEKSKYQPLIFAAIALGTAYAACGHMQVSLLAATAVFTAGEYI